MKGGFIKKMAKRKSKEVVKCEKCDREFKVGQDIEYPGKVYVHKGKVMCEDCLIDMGVSLDEADPYAIYYSH